MDEERSVEDIDAMEQPDLVEQPDVIDEADQIEAVVAEPDDTSPIEDPRVIAAVERLADLEGLPVAEQVEIFADIHARLTEALGTDPSPTASA